MDEYDNTLPDNDHIWLDEIEGSSIGVGANEVEVVLTTAPNVTWWKEIMAFDKKATALAWIQTQDNAHGPVAMRLDVTLTDSIVFSKAKFLGIHTAMYQVLDLASRRGKRVIFNWRSD